MKYHNYGTLMMKFFSHGPPNKTTFIGHTMRSYVFLEFDSGKRRSIFDEIAKDSMRTNEGKLALPKDGRFIGPCLISL